MTATDQCDTETFSGEGQRWACQAFLAPIPKDRRVRRTISCLHEAVVSLLPEKPFETITVQDIVDRAGVSRPAFYAHFADKFALMEYIVDAVFNRFLVDAFETTESETPERLRLLALVTCNYLTEIFKQCRHARRLLDPLIQSRISTRLHEILKQWLGDDALRGAGDPAGVELTATVIGWSIYGSALNWARQPDRAPVESFLDSGEETILGAYRTWRESRPSRTVASAEAA